MLVTKSYAQVRFETVKIGYCMVLKNAASKKKIAEEEASPQGAARSKPYRHDTQRLLKRACA